MVLKGNLADRPLWVFWAHVTHGMRFCTSLIMRPQLRICARGRGAFFVGSEADRTSGPHPPPVRPSRVLVNGLNRMDSFEILGRKVD